MLHMLGFVFEMILLRTFPSRRNENRKAIKGGYSFCLRVQFCS